MTPPDTTPTHRANSVDGTDSAATRPIDASRLRGWMFLAFAVVSEVSATLCLKGALDQPFLYAVVVAGYVAAFTALSFALRTGLGLGIAYGVWGASGVVLTAIASMLLFGEPMTFTMWGGIGLVVAGVLFVELGSQHAHSADALAAATLATGEFPVIEAEADSDVAGDAR